MSLSEHLRTYQGELTFPSYICGGRGAVSDLSRNMEYPSYTKGKGKVIPVTGRTGSYDCETSRFPHFLENRITDGDEVSLKREPPFTPRKIPGTHFC
jgi:hypothetical protein